METICLPKDMTAKELNHELRNPLTEILGSAELLSDEYLTYKQKEHLNDIISGANKLVQLTNQLLEAKVVLDSHMKMDAFKNKSGTLQGIEKIRF